MMKIKIQAPGAQSAHFPGFFKLQRQQRTEHADERHQRGDQLHGGGDREGAVEDIQGSLAQRATRVDLHFREARQLRAQTGGHGIHIGTRRQEQADPIQALIPPQPAVDIQTHAHCSARGGVIRENTRDREGLPALRCQ